MRYPWRNKITGTNEGIRKLFRPGRTFGTQFLERNFNPESGGSFGKTGVLPLNFDDQQSRQFQDFLSWSQDKGYARVGAKEWKEYAKSVGLVGTAGKKAAGMLKGFGAALINIGASMAIMWAIQAVINLIDKFNVTVDEAKESLNEFYSEVEGGRNKLRDQKSFLSSSEVQEWATLSKGVSGFGKNISLTADEFSKYQSVSNSIAEQFPNLVSGWDAQGNAILKTKGSIEELTKAYEESVEAYHLQTLEDGAEKFKHYNIAVDGASWSEGSIYFRAKALEDFINNDFDSYLHQDVVKGLQRTGVKGEAGVKTEASTQYYSVTDKAEQQKIITEYKNLINQLNSETQKVKPLFTAYLEVESLGYQTLSDGAKDVINKVVNSFDYEFLKQFKGNLDEVKFWIENNLVSIFNEHPEVEVAFNDFIKLEVDKISEAEYEQAIDKLFESLKDENGKWIVNEEIIIQLKTAFGIDSEEAEKERDKAIEEMIVNNGIITSSNNNATPQENTVRFKGVSGFTPIGNGKVELTEKQKEDSLTNKAKREELEQVLSKSDIDLLLSGKISPDKWAGKTVEQVKEIVEEFKKANPEILASKELLEEYSKTLDNIQSAYQSVQGAIKEYNEQGFFSVDTFQKLITLEPKYLNMLMDENGNLNLNTQAVQENTKAYIENASVQAAMNMVTELSNIQGEAAQIEYLSGVLAVNTEVTWANIEALIQQQEALYNSSNGAQGFSEKVAADTRAKVAAMKKMSEATLAGVGKGGLGTDAGKTADNVKNINDQLKELAESEALEQLKYKFDQIELSVQKISDSIGLLDTSLANTSEDDYIGKIDIVNRQIELARQKSSLLRNEFAQLQASEYHTADMANELATRMKSVADGIAENSNSILEYGKNLTEYYMSALSNLSKISKNPLDESMDNFERNTKALIEGSLTGLQFDLSPIVPESAYEKQRAENLSLEEEMRRYYDSVAEMQKIALDMQHQEQVADNAKKRQELLDSLNEATATIADFNATTSAMQKEDNAEKLDETKTFVEGAKSIIGDLINWAENNPIKVIVDTSSADSSIDALRTKVNNLDREMNFSNNSLTGSTGNKILDTASKYKGTPYIYGGGHGGSDKGLDCSGYVSKVLTELGYMKGATNADGFKSVGKKVEASSMQPGDILIFDYGHDGTADHVAFYAGDGKMWHSSGNEKNTANNPGKGVILGNYSDYYKKALTQVRRVLATGTPSGNAAAKNLALAGENYKPEILIDKATGKPTYIDKPTVIDISKTDVVGEKATAKIPKFATGTPTTDPYILSLIKKASEETGVPANIIMAVMDHETGYKWYDKVSDGTGYSYGYMMLYDNGAIADIRLRKGEAAAQKAKTDKYTNVYEGADLLRRHYASTGSWQEAAKRYNGSGENARKYGEKVWKEANTDAFKNAAKNLGSIAAYTEDTANNTSEIVTRKDFSTQLKNLINGTTSPSSENSQKWEDGLLDYIKENTSESINFAEQYVESFQKLADYNEKAEKDFAKVDQHLVNAVGKSHFESTRNNTNKKVADHISSVMSMQTELETRSAMQEFEKAREIQKVTLEYFNERKKNGAGSDELQTIATSYAEATELVNEYSDKYVKAINAQTEYLMSVAQHEIQVFNEQLSWLEDKGEDLQTIYEDIGRELSNIDDLIGDTDNLVEQNNLHYDKIKLYDKEISSIKQLISHENSLINVQNERQNKAHQMVLDLYNNENYKPIFDRFDIETWFDANGEATAQFASDIQRTQVTEGLKHLTPTMNEIFKIIQFCKQEYYNAEDAKKESVERNKELNDTLKETQKIQEESEKQTKLNRVEAYVQYQERLAEALNFEKTANDALTSSKTAYYDFIDSLRDEQNAINAQLKANMQIDDWLSEDTRNLLFNLEDYEKETAVITELNNEAQRLYVKYQQEVSNLKEDEFYKEEAITAEYNKQLETLNEKLGIAKQELQVRKDQAAFENALKERDTQIIMGNRVQNVADPEKLRQLAEAQAKSELELDNLNIKADEAADIRDMSRISDAFANEIAERNNMVDMIKSFNEEQLLKFSTMVPIIDETMAMINSLSKWNVGKRMYENDSQQVYENLDKYKTGTGYNLAVDYTGQIEEIDRWIAEGVVDKDKGEEIKERLMRAHDTKALTNPLHRWMDYDLFDVDNKGLNYRDNSQYADTYIDEFEREAILNARKEKERFDENKAEFWEKLEEEVKNQYSVDLAKTESDGTIIVKKDGTYDTALTPRTQVSNDNSFSYDLYEPAILEYMGDEFVKNLGKGNVVSYDDLAMYNAFREMIRDTTTGIGNMRNILVSSEKAFENTTLSGEGYAKTEFHINNMNIENPVGDPVELCRAINDSTELLYPTIKNQR